MAVFADTRGGKIVFQSTRDGNSEIYSINADGTNLTRLTNNPALDINPRLSLDGRQIAFASNRSGHFEIWAMTIGGLNLHQVTEGSDEGHESTEAAWSPDNKLLAVITRGKIADIDRSGLFLINADGTPKATLVPPSNYYLLQEPDYSPDGKFIIYSTTNYQTRANWISRIGIGGGTPQELTSRTEESASGPAIRPDGKMMAYWRSGQIWTYDLVSGARGSLGIVTARTLVDYSPAGDEIVYSQGGVVYAARVSDLATRQITGFEAGVSGDTHAVWGPGQRQPALEISIGDAAATESAGSLTFTVTLSAAQTQDVQIAYVTEDGNAKSTEDYTATTGTLNIAAGARSATITVPIKSDSVFEVDEHFYVRLSSGSSYVTRDATGTGTILNDDSVGARGGKIAFTSNRAGGNSDIWVMNADGTNQTRLTTDAAADRNPSFSSDGRRIVFVSERGGNPDLWIMNADGSAQTRLTTTTEREREPSFSYDGRQIVFLTGQYYTDEQHLCIMNADGSNVRVLKIMPRRYYMRWPSIRPDGQTILYIAFDDRDPTLYELSLAGGGERQLSTSVYSAGYLPQGDSIAFNTTYLYIGDLNLQNSHVVPNSYYVNTICPSPSGTAFAYYVNFGPGSEIFTIDINGAQRQLTYNSSEDTEPTWAPGTIGNIGPPALSLTIDDGGRIESDNGAPKVSLAVRLGKPSGNAVTVNYATSDRTAFAPGDYTAASGTVTFAPGETVKLIDVFFNPDAFSETNEYFAVKLSNPVGATLADDTGIVTIYDDDSAGPFGGRIVWASNRDGNFEIYAMNAGAAAGTYPTPVRLTNNPAADQAPAISIDGTKIAFYSNRDGNNEIYLLDVDSNGLKRLTNNSGGDVAPNFSPGGDKIVFASTRDGNSEIYIMNVDGTAQTRLTSDPGADAVPAFDASGTKIAFTSTRNGNREIYSMNLDGSGIRRLTNNAAEEGAPAWSRDGQFIAFQSNRLGQNELYVMNADGTGVRRLTENPAEDGDPAWSPDGKTLAFSTDRDKNYEIYTIPSAGGTETRLTNSVGGDIQPAWGPYTPARVTITDVTSREGSSGMTDFVFLLRLSRPSDQQVSVTANLAFDTAQRSDVDVNFVNKVTFAPNEISKTLTIKVVGDTVYEPDERFYVDLVNPENARITDSRAIGTIVNDDALDSHGGVVVWSSERDGNAEIYIMNADGTNPTVLNANPAQDTEPQVSRDGTQIVWVSTHGQQSGTNPVIWLMNSDGTNARQLNPYSTGIMGQPTFGPENQLAFTYLSPNSSTGYRAVYGPNGALTDTASDNYSPTWSVDGKQIAFVSTRESTPANPTDIWIMSSVGGANGPKRRLLQSPGSEDTPRYNLDGTKIAFASNRDGNWEIYEMNSDGTGVTRMTNNAAEDRAPAWSPDGQTLLFHSNRSGNNNEIFRMPVQPNGLARALAPNRASDVTPFAAVGSLNLPAVTIDDVSAAEGSANGSTKVPLTVRLSHASNSATWVDIEFNSGTADLYDYSWATQTVVFEPGQTEKIVLEPVVSDKVKEGDEYFYAHIYRSSGLLLSRPLATITIVDDD